MISTSLPTSYLYTIENGQLKSIPRYHGMPDEPILPENYALFYPEKVGKLTSPDIKAKIFVIKAGGHKIKEFYSSKYGNVPKFLREAAEKYIFDELTNGQQTLSVAERKKSKVKKSSTPNCKCRK